MEPCLFGFQRLWRGFEKREYGSIVILSLKSAWLLLCLVWSICGIHSLGTFPTLFGGLMSRLGNGELIASLFRSCSKDDDPLGLCSPRAMRELFWLLLGCLVVKVFLTAITFQIKVCQLLIDNYVMGRSRRESLFRPWWLVLFLAGLSPCCFSMLSSEFPSVFELLILEVYTLNILSLQFVVETSLVSFQEYMRWSEAQPLSAEWREWQVLIFSLLIKYLLW